ncbi:MAG: SUMF1/EgtB/PvdO family nonheme iron enzyme [Candidatus Tectomicrobia bacterium]
MACHRFPCSPAPLLPWLASVCCLLLVWGAASPLSSAQQRDPESLAQLQGQLRQAIDALQHTAQIDKSALTQAIANLEAIIRAGEAQAAAHPDLLADLRTVVQQLRAATRFGGRRQPWSTYSSPLAAPPSPRLAEPASSVPAQVESAVPHDAMIPIPAGTFWFGSDPRDPQRGAEELQRRQVQLAAFLIAPYEVTNAAYQQFRPSLAFPAGHETFPVTGVTWLQARAFAQWAGARLCHEEEWEKAAKGPNDSLFPFGNAFTPGIAHLELDLARGAARVGSYPDDRSGYGVFDLAGNVFEWTASQPEEHEDLRVFRGGAWFAVSAMGRSSARDFASPDDADETLGFRLCRDAKQ